MSTTFPLPPTPPLPRPGRVRGRSSATERQALLSSTAPRMPWDRFVRQLDWKPGEHVALIGPTGQGKTTLMLNLLPLRTYVAFLATKPRDPAFNKLQEMGYVRMNSWRAVSATDTPKRLVWPDARRIDSEETQRAILQDAIARIYREGGWTVAIDEMWYMVNVLKMQREMRIMLLQGRSLGISVVAATQRPKFVPLEIYDQSTHLFFWRDNDENNLQRLSGINVRSSAAVKEIIPNLERHQVLYINTRTGEMLRTRAPAPDGGNQA